MKRNTLSSSFEIRSMNRIKVWRKGCSELKKELEMLFQNVKRSGLFLLFKNRASLLNPHFAAPVVGDFDEIRKELSKNFGLRKE
jgi:phosphoheptose isomerase